MRQWLIIAAMLVTGAAAAARDASPQAVQDGTTPASAADPAAIDATRLGVSLARIQKGLRVSPSTEIASGTAMKLNFQVQVFGVAPRIDVIQDFDIVHGPTPGTAPTHSDILYHLTPQAFRAPAVPISTAVAWVAQQIWNKSAKSKCEREIEEYRAMVMQGMSVSAPRCAR